MLLLACCTIDTQCIIRLLNDFAYCDVTGEPSIWTDDLIIYLPDGLRQNELLYSAIARSCRLQRVPASRDMLWAAFKAATIRAIIDLPCRLDIAGSRLLCLAHEANPGERLLNLHTLFPFYGAVVDPEVARRAADVMLASSGGRVHGMLGVRPSNIRTPAYLRYCTDCVALDRCATGTAWWRRAHQLAGAFVCSEHGTPLSMSRRLTSSSRELLAFHDLESSISNDDLVCFDSDAMGAHVPVLQELARQAVGLLSVGPSGRSGSRRLWEHRSDALQAAGFTRGRKIDLVRLRSALSEYFGSRLLDMLHCQLGGDTSDDWAARMARPPRRSAHPVYHLLMAVLLGIDVVPPGTVDHRYDRTAADSAAGWALTGVPEAVATSSDRDRRIMEALDRHPEARSSFIAREAGVDDLTVKRVAWRQGRWRAEWSFSSKVVPATKGTEKRRATLDSARRRWSELTRTDSGLDRTGLRAAEPAVYALLYRRDRAWLEANSPPAKRPRGLGRRVDWGARDVEVSASIEVAAADLIVTPRSRALRPATFARKADVLSLLEQHRERMPG